MPYGKRDNDDLDLNLVYLNACPDTLAICKTNTSTDPKLIRSTYTYSMSFKNSVPKNYFCYFNQTDMEDTDWEVNKTTTEAVTTYLYQQEKETKTKKVWQNGHLIKKRVSALEWDAESENDQMETLNLYGGRQLYSGVLQQGLLILNKDNTVAGGSDVTVLVSDVGEGAAAKAFF